MSKIMEPKSAKPKIVVLYCQHSVDNDLNVTACTNSLENMRVRSVVMPCSSKVQVAHLLHILDQEADGVEVIACPTHCCRHLVGSSKMDKRVAYAQELLKSIGQAPDRIGITHGLKLTANEFVKQVSARAEAVKDL
jgi:coenzyme F420-reducing hydrogenase delta subunit